MQFFESNNAYFPIDVPSFPPTEETAFMPTQLSMQDPASLLSEFNLLFDTILSGDEEHQAETSSFPQHDYLDQPPHVPSPASLLSKFNPRFFGIGGEQHQAEAPSFSQHYQWHQPPDPSSLLSEFNLQFDASSSGIGDEHHTAYPPPQMDPSSLLSEFSLQFDASSSGIGDEHRLAEPSIPSQRYYNFLEWLPPLQPAPGHSMAHISPQRRRSVTPGTPPIRQTRTRNGERQTEEERYKALQNDKDVLEFRETWVRCARCGQKIQLDSRNGARYYPRAFWNHKESCGRSKKRKGRRQTQRGLT